MSLRCERISFGYRADRPVVREVSLAVTPGRITVLLGPNGSGKSTLLKLLLGTLKPGSGEIEWEGRTLRAHRPRELARGIAYLPQSPGYEAGQSVAEVLRAGRTPYLQAFGLESLRDAEVVARTAELLGLAELMDRPMEELSGGQRQRAFLGRALAQEPRVFLLDEPNTFLDLQHQAQLWQLLRTLAREKHLAILAASHDLNLSAAFADELLLLHDGTVVASGAPETVLNAELLSRVYGIGMERIDRVGKTPVVFPAI
ncbi:MAG: transporter ATP-binding protein [Phycisphaerales bacterium]|nr:transporter ATP-binding protein [Phycisphaerales bacterium]